MILNLETKEVAVLVLHMSIMRKNVRKGFKSNYGNEAKEILVSYDEVKNTMISALKEMAEQEEKRDFNFNIREIEMLSSFLDFYIVQFQAVIDESKDNVSQEDKLQVDYLHIIKSKVDSLWLQVAGR